MDKIRIRDLIEEEHREKQPGLKDRAIVPWKKRKQRSLLALAFERIIFFLALSFSALRKLKLQEAVSALKDLNLYRKLREGLTNFYLRRTVLTIPAKKDKLIVFWQPVPFILAKILIVAAVSLWFYNLYPMLGKWLKTGFDFFRLQDIYTFEFPKQPFFDSIAMYLILFVIGYYGLYFLYHQCVAFLSVLVINQAEDKVYIVRNVFVKKALYVFSIRELALVVLRQSMIGGLFGIGTISLEKKSGELVEIKSVSGARRAVRLLAGAGIKSKETLYDRV